MKVKSFLNVFYSHLCNDEKNKFLRCDNISTIPLIFSLHLFIYLKLLMKAYQNRLSIFRTSSV